MPSHSPDERPDWAAFLVPDQPLDAADSQYRKKQLAYKRRAARSAQRRDAREERDDR